MPGEFEFRRRDFWMAAQERETLSFDKFLGTQFVIVFFQRRFVIEQVELGRRAYHVQIDDLFGARREMWFAGRQRIRCCGRRGQRVKATLCYAG